MLDAKSFARSPNWNARGGDPDQEAMRLYVTSYLLTRALVGILGIALPIALVIGQAFVFDESAKVRGSISAYYHSPMRDEFVGVLSIIGILLITYMAGTWNVDFVASFIGGFAVIGLAWVPTDRPDLPAGAPRCGASPEPTDCAPVQKLLGEAHSADIHYTFTAIFLVSLVIISAVFGWREWHFLQKRGVALFHWGCSAVIVLSVALILAGQIHHFTIASLTPLYIGEFVTVLAFGASWLVKGWDIHKALFPRGL